MPTHLIEFHRLGSARHSAVALHSLSSTTEALANIDYFPPTEERSYFDSTSFERQTDGFNSQESVENGHTAQTTENLDDLH